MEDNAINAFEEDAAPRGQRGQYNGTTAERRRLFILAMNRPGANLRDQAANFDMT